MPRKKKVVEDGVILDGTENKKTFKCLRCGKEYDVAMGHFYRITYSPLFKANDGYAPICKECVNEMFDDFSRRFGSDRTACMLKLPIDTNLTNEPGDIQIQLTFVDVTMDPDGTTVQHVRKVGPGVITVVPIQNWSDIVPDEALGALDQRIIALNAQIKALSDRNNAILDGKADDLSYNDDHTLQLLANGKPIGSAVKITQESVETEDGSLRVVPF